MQSELWQRACDASNVPPEVSEKWLKKLQEKYSSREYHNENMLNFKIKSLLTTITTNAADISNQLIFAIYFQYYEYDVREDCSLKNCKHFQQFYDECKIDNVQLLNNTLFLLGNTSNTASIDMDEIKDDLNLYQDLDLFIFGSDPKAYKDFMAKLQAEYAHHMDEKSYRTMRLKILQTFLTIPTIYSTEMFRERYEQIARTNISNEIMELKN